MDKVTKTRYLSVLTVLALFVLIAAALIGQNFQRTGKQAQPVVALLERNAYEGKQREARSILSLKPGETCECLYLWDSKDGNSELFHRQMPQILHDMRVDYIEVDIRKEQMPDLNVYGFEKIIIGFADYGYGREALRDIMEWAKDGGEVLAAVIPEVSGISRWMSQHMGIEGESINFYETPGIRISEGFMLTGEKNEYEIENSFQSSRMVELSDDCRVFIESADTNKIPILWSRPYGEGKIVVVNLGIYEKAYRGIYGAAYSLLGSACVYPVINGSAFFIDDFPTPIMDRTEKQVLENYQMSIENFYSRIWWESMNSLAKKYDFSYTATILESYDDIKTPPFPANENRWQYEYFGNLLLNAGGEIGLHGYNHMPLALDDSDYKEDFPDYESWKSKEDMKSSIDALKEFCESLFPDEKFLVYVPPSNILTAEGREMLAQSFPEVCSVAGSYLVGNNEFIQEFKVEKDGIVDTPRIALGYQVDADGRIGALSELNLHFVNAHCQYPDRVLDAGTNGIPEWEEMLESFTEYVDWVYQAAPGIRNVTGSELAAAVQRFYYLEVHKEETKDMLILNLDQFSDEAWLMLRFNDFEPEMGDVEGGSLTKLEGDLYLLKAENSEIRIRKKD